MAAEWEGRLFKKYERMMESLQFNMGKGRMQIEE